MPFAISLGRQLPTNESVLRKVHFDLASQQQVTDLLQVLAEHGLYNEIQVADDTKSVEETEGSISRVVAFPGLVI